MPGRPKHASPPVQLRIVLTAARARGEPFDAAWDRAMSRRGGGRVRCARQWWHDVLEEQKPLWRAAYNRESVTALAQLPVLLEALRTDESSGAFRRGQARPARPLVDVASPQDLDLQHRSAAA